MRRIAETGTQRQRGAVAVVVAIWMVVLIGFTAVAVDLAGAYSEKQQLQNGADAAALAIANSCLNGTCVDSADTYAKANKLDGVATGTVVGGMTSPVTVKASYTRENWFGGILGFPTTDISATAHAEWGAISGGSTWPITFSWCQFESVTGVSEYGGSALSTTEKILFFKDDNGCSSNAAHGYIAGGFNFLDSVDCVATVAADGTVGSEPGYDGPSTCDADDYSDLLNSTILIPIFNETAGSGQNGTYTIEAMAAFKVTGYSFKNKYEANWAKKDDKGIKGYFTTLTDVTGNYTFDSSATNFGASGMRLSG